MANVRPFSVVGPDPVLAGVVISPPYDVLTDAEAREIATEARSFVHVTRSEVDLPIGADSHSEQAYAKARENLDSLLADGILQQASAPTYVVYGQTMGEHTQIGLVGAASVEEYDDGRIAKHEFTRPDKEDDRTHHMAMLDAQVGLVFLTYRPSADIDRIVAQASERTPTWQVTTEDDVVHTTWSLTEDERDSIQAAFTAIPTIYIADGHHRSAAASRIHAERDTELSAFFLAGLYPSDQLQVMAYNRVVHDLNGHSSEGFLQAVSERWTVSPATGGVPAGRGEVRMYLGGSWHALQLKDAHVRTDPVGCLDISGLQDHLLQPLLGIEDPRRSTRITFVGGIRGAAELQRQVDGGGAVAFHLHPTSLDELFAVADAGEVMPPKSTWFEPKLREGVALRLLR